MAGLRLGPRGGNLHSPDEFLLLDSLTERAALAAVTLNALASGGIADLTRGSFPGV